MADARDTLPPDVTAHVIAQVAAILPPDSKAVSVFEVDSGSSFPFRAETTTLQLDVRAASKEAARLRAYEVRRVLLKLPSVEWADGVCNAVEVVTGPGYVPDNGAPRYVLRVTVLYHPKA